MVVGVGFAREASKKNRETVDIFREKCELIRLLPLLERFSFECRKVIGFAH